MQALGDLLKVTHRGYFIPPRPEKNPMEGQRATDDFVELRRSALERYINQLALHPAIAQSDVSTYTRKDPPAWATLEDPTTFLHAHLSC